ncbi:MAG: pantetheine-phosphate adenylyltransferase [Rickettsiales bacterium]|nr:pantetheine-phosphate adenylyltransferase [Rickettsiales bacterium]|tara:strand:+ start:13467 stop:13979 length:513 start_codon:yes stop_codon:yes gene_type:complete
MAPSCVPHIAVYPGSFDPITYGHLDIIQRAVKLVDKLIIAVGTNQRKNALFTLDERQKMVEGSLVGIGKEDRQKIYVMSFDGLLVEFAKNQSARSIIRGLRAVSDFDYEFQMASMNRKICDQLETIFLMSSDHMQFVASSLVREIANMQGDISKFVPKLVEQSVKRKVNI